MDHSEDITHAQQERSFHNHYGNHCYLPLCLLEGLSGKFITAVRRPGKRHDPQTRLGVAGRAGL